MDANPNILTRPGLGTDPRVNFEHCLSIRHLCYPPMHLVRATHFGERFQGHLNQGRMGNPSAVVAVFYFALLVGTNFGQRGVVGRGIILDRDLRRHPAHRMRAAAVAGVDQPQRIRREERLIHGHRRAIGGQPLGVATNALDGRKDVIPAAAI